MRKRKKPQCQRQRGPGDPDHLSHPPCPDAKGQEPHTIGGNWELTPPEAAHAVMS